MVFLFCSKVDIFGTGITKAEIERKKNQMTTSLINTHSAEGRGTLSLLLRVILGNASIAEC